MLEFRLGWNYESFHQFLSESLTHELVLADKVVAARKHLGKGCGAAGGSAGALTGGAGGWDTREGWHSEVRLRILGLTRLEQILRQLQGSGAGRAASCVSPPALEQVAALVQSLQECLKQ